MSDARQPTGDAGLGMGDFAANVAMGLPPLMGPCFFDDFIGNQMSPFGYYGDRLWALQSSGTPTAVALEPTSTNEFEIGLLRCTATSSGDYGILYQNTSARILDQEPPIGSVFAISCRVDTSTSDVTLWAGFTENLVPPISSNNTDFVGLRYASSVDSSWFGVVRNGTSETTVDTNFVASTSASSQQIIGFERMPDGSYEFFLVVASDPGRAPYVLRTAAVDTNHPSSPSTICFGWRADTTATRGMVVDWIAWGGRSRRS